MNENDLWELPKAWCWSEVAPLVDGISAGKSFKCDERPPADDEIGVVKVSAVTWGFYNELESKTCTRPELVDPELFVRTGDFLFSRANTIELVGACVIADRVTRKVMLSDKILRFSVRSGWDRWLLWSLRSSHGRAEIERLASGNQDSMRNIGQSRILSIRIPIPPQGEQGRVVDAIESYFSRLDDAVTTLERVERNLKRYRASVLKSAVEGRLVPTEAALAKQEGRTYEPASVLLERILSERRRRWSESGKKGKYQEPTPPDTTNLPMLPEGWCWASMDQFLVWIEAGKSFRCEERPPNPDEIGVVKVSAVSWGRFQENESKTCNRAEHANEELLIRPGDFLISRANTVGLVGACVIAGPVSLRVMLSDKILRMHIAGDHKEWLLWVLRSGFGRFQIEALATGNQDSMRNIGQTAIGSICVPLPPESESRRIVADVESQISMADHAAGTTKWSLVRASRLRQSILKWAFEGKLADQDSTDEPASLLLERIKAERTTTKPATPTTPQRKAAKKKVRA